MNSKDVLKALSEIEEFRGLTMEVLVDALNAALINAFRKINEKDSLVRPYVDLKTGQISIYHQKNIVEEVKDDALEISLDDAKAINKSYNVGDVFETFIDVDSLSRAAALQFKQTLIQKIREAIKTETINEFISKKHDIIVGKVEKVEPKLTILSIGRSGRTTAFLNYKNSIPNEKFTQGDIINVYVLDVDKKGIVSVSRSDPGFLKRLFEKEITEIYDGTVEIRAIAREPGRRAKVAVSSSLPNVDPIGACIGQKGMRIQKITNQIAGEKIDVIQYHDNPALFIVEALKPAKALGISINDEAKSAVVVVSNEDYSISIGKEGQNVRLTVKLTGWKVDVKTVDQAFAEGIQYTDVRILRETPAAAVVEEVKPVKPEVVVPTPAIEVVAPVVVDEVAPVEAPKPKPKKVEKPAEPVVAVTPAPVVPSPIPVVAPTPVPVKPVVVAPLPVAPAPVETPKPVVKPVKKKEQPKPAPTGPKPNYMPVYTEDELREIEATEQPEKPKFEDDIDYDEFDKYYDEEK